MLKEGAVLMRYYGEKEARDLVIEAGHRLLENKLIARTWGNISARISEDEFVITPSGRAYDSLCADDLVIVKVSDASYEGDVKPSSEKGAHAAAYSLRTDAAFIIHTHQYYASAVAAECRDVSFAPCADYALPGTARLKETLEACISAMPGYDSFLMARHGTLILGSSFEDAFAKAEELEERCRELVESRTGIRMDDDSEDFDQRADEAQAKFDSINIKALPHIKVVSDPYIMRCCASGKTVGSFIDDFAQIAGPDIQVVENDVWSAEQALLGHSSSRLAKKLRGMPMTGALDRMGGQQPLLNSVIGRNAVLVKGVGAVCAGKTESDAEAIAMIVSKNCAAACYVRRAKPLGIMDARLQRYIYLSSYSKRIDD